MKKLFHKINKLFPNDSKALLPYVLFFSVIVLERCNNREKIPKQTPDKQIKNQDVIFKNFLTVKTNNEVNRNIE